RRGRACRLGAGGARQGGRHRVECGIADAYLNRSPRRADRSRAAGDRGAPFEYLPPRELPSALLRLACRHGRHLRAGGCWLRACAGGNGRHRRAGRNVTARKGATRGKTKAKANKKERPRMTAKDEAEKPSAEQKLIRDLADLLNDTGLSEIEIEKSGLKI